MGEYQNFSDLQNFCYHLFDLGLKTREFEKGIPVVACDDRRQFRFRYHRVLSIFLSGEFEASHQGVIHSIQAQYIQSNGVRHLDLIQS